MARISFRGNTGWNGKPRQQARNSSSYRWVNPAAYPRKSAEQWRREIAELLETDALILDTETTGINGDVRVIELSIVDLQGNIVFHSLFNPGMPLPEKIPELTGITDEMVQGAPYFHEKVSEILDVITGKCLIAWNSDFDRKWITNELLLACQGPAAIGVRWVDAMEMYAFSTGREKKWCKLIAAKNEQEIGDSQEHRSSADCLDTLAVLRRVAGFDKPDNLLSRLDAWEAEQC